MSKTWGFAVRQAYLLALLHALASIGAQRLCQALHELQSSHGWRQPAKTLQLEAALISQLSAICVREKC